MASEDESDTTSGPEPESGKPLERDFARLRSVKGAM